MAPRRTTRSPETPQEAVARIQADPRVAWLPVRHHSPACARRVRELARRMKPAVVLIEGPSDFKDRLGELYLPHREVLGQPGEGGGLVHPAGAAERPAGEPG